MQYKNQELTDAHRLKPAAPHGSLVHPPKRFLAFTVSWCAVRRFTSRRTLIHLASKRTVQIMIKSRCLDVGNAGFPLPGLHEQVTLYTLAYPKPLARCYVAT